MSVDITTVPLKFAWRTSPFSMNRFISALVKKRYFFQAIAPAMISKIHRLLRA